MNRSTLLILATVALALMLAACTGAAAAPSVASLDDPAASGTPAPSASPMTPQDAALAYAGCMRENGIDMPDPVVTDDGEGRVSISQGASDRNGSKEEFLEAEEECRHFMEAAMPTEDREPLSAEDMDKMLAFAQCMREHGIPMDDPSADGGIRIGIDDSGTRRQAADQRGRARGGPRGVWGPAARQDGHQARPEQRGRRARWRLQGRPRPGGIELSRVVRLLGALVVLAVIVGGGWWLTGGGVAASPPATADPDAEAAGTQTAVVERKTLTVTEAFGATLGFSGDYAVIGGLSGTLTRTVPLGTIVKAGRWLYETNGRDRTSLMYGKRPAWRALGPSVSNGADVLQLEENLKRLGYSRKGFKVDRDWDAHTTAAVKRWQRDAGLAVDGVIDLGEVVFLPEAIRVTEIGAALGSMVGQGAPVITGTSTRRVVSLDIDADDRGLFEFDKAVEVELPDGTTVVGNGRIDRPDRRDLDRPAGQHHDHAPGHDRAGRASGRR